MVARKEPVFYHGLKVKINGTAITFNLILRPATYNEGSTVTETDCLLVILEAASEHSPAVSDERLLPDITNTILPDGISASEYLKEIEERLKEKEEYLQAAFEEMQTSNEELKSTNEELQSVNEELQSSNEDW